MSQIKISRIIIDIFMFSELWLMIYFLQLSLNQNNYHQHVFLLILTTFIYIFTSETYNKKSEFC